MRIKITIMIIGLLFLTNLTNRVGSRTEAIHKTGEKILTIRHFDCLPQKQTDAVCEEKFQITVSEKPKEKNGTGNGFETIKLTDEILSELIRQTVLEPDKLIC